MRYISIDIETTGLSDDCGIIEFGAVADDFKEGQLVEALPTFHCYFNFKAIQGEPYALSIHYDTFRKIANQEEGYNYYDPMGFGNHFKQWLIRDCGYNPTCEKVLISVAGKNFGSLDYKFLKSKTDIFDHIEMNTIFIDPTILFVEKDDESLPGLAQCKRRAGLDDYVDHTALADAIDVVRLLRFSIGPTWGILDE
tara:strand:+ start:11714 stop:12301 length:588 start_codon:yes stop_codon:yes gene_type:complete